MHTRLCWQSKQVSFESYSMFIACGAAPVCSLWFCGQPLHHHPQGGCDAKAQGDRAPEQLSAADASNSAKAKRENSVSLILVYIRLSDPAVQPHLLAIPNQDDRAQWRRTCRNSFTPSHPGPPPPSPPTVCFLWPYLREGTPQKASVP